MMLSRRAYAKRNKISERRVRTLVNEGVLADAVDPETNLIDAGKADQLLAKSLTKPKDGRTPVILQTAKMRRARAVALDLEDEVKELESSLTPPGWAEQYLNGLQDEVAVIIRRWPFKIAPALVGLSAYEVQRALKQGVEDLLGELHEELSQPRDRDDDAVEEAK